MKSKISNKREDKIKSIKLLLQTEFQRRRDFETLIRAVYGDSNYTMALAEMVCED